MLIWILGSKKQILFSRKTWVFNLYVNDHCWYYYSIAAVRLSIQEKKKDQSFDHIVVATILHFLTYPVDIYNSRAGGDSGSIYKED